MFSPLESVQKRTGTGSELARLRNENVSVISFDSIQTTERLLDKLDLSNEEELLLQKALEERNEQQELKSSAYNPSVCLPASGFPSLRHSSGHSASSHRRGFSTGSTPIVADGNKVVSTKAAAIESNVADLRYSYIAVEEPDDEYENAYESGNGNRDIHENGSNRNRESKEMRGNPGKDNSVSDSKGSRGVADVPINIEKFRFRKHEPVRYNVTPPITNMMFSPYHKLDFETPVHTPSHTPKASLSSIVLNHPTTQSSSESEQSVLATNNVFQTPNKDSKGKMPNNYLSEVSTPPPKDFKKGHQAKKSLFSLKNLFRSPKVPVVEGPASPTRNAQHQITVPNKSTSAPSTPLETFKFPQQLGHSASYDDKPLPEVNEYRKSPENAGSKGSTNTNNNNNNSENIFGNPKHRKADSQGALVDHYSKTPVKSQHTYKMLLEPRPTVLSVPHSYSGLPSAPSSSESFSFPNGNRDRDRDRDRYTEYPKSAPHGNHSTTNSTSTNTSYNSAPSDLSLKSSSNKRMIAKQRINMAIDLRNKGYAKESTAHLKEACKLGDRTAFLLYGLALRYGSGTEIDLKESFNWIRGATGVKDFKATVLHANVDPFELPEPLPYRDNDAAAPALYECGIAYLKGYGVLTSEWKGLKCLEYAASLGHVDSMCLCGTIWSKASAHRKKDTRRAAKWFRLAQKHGADLIGADWIYKDQYM